MRYGMIMQSVETSSVAGTQKIARDIAKSIAKISAPRARIIALTGDLGAGKTTFVQGFAEALGVKESVTSPTFVLMKIYALKRQKHITHLVHIDAYRIETPAELLHLGFHELLRDSDAVIVIEWAERIKKILPKDTIWVTFEHGRKINKRMIIIQSGKMKHNGVKTNS